MNKKPQWNVPSSSNGCKVNRFSSMLGQEPQGERGAAFREIRLLARYRNTYTWRAGNSYLSHGGTRADKALVDFCPLLWREGTGFRMNLDGKTCLHKAAGINIQHGMCSMFSRGHMADGDLPSSRSQPAWIKVRLGSTNTEGQGKKHEFCIT